MKSFSDTPMCDLAVQRRIPERTTRIKHGTRFYHTRLLAEDYKSPALCEITRVAQGVVYYRPVAGGVSEYTPIERFPRIVRAYA